MPQYLVIFLPIIVTLLSGWLTEVTLPAWANTVITSIIVLGSAVLLAFLTQRLVPDLMADFVIIAGFSATLVAEPLKPLEQYLQIKLPSPLRLALPKANSVDSTLAISPTVATASQSSSSALPAPNPTIAMPTMPASMQQSQAVPAAPVPPNTAQGTAPAAAQNQTS